MKQVSFWPRRYGKQNVGLISLIMQGLLQIIRSRRNILLVEVIIEDTYRRIHLIVRFKANIDLLRH